MPKTIAYYVAKFDNLLGATIKQLTLVKRHSDKFTLEAAGLFGEHSMCNRYQRRPNLNRF